MSVPSLRGCSRRAEHLSQDDPAGAGRCRRSCFVLAGQSWPLDKLGEASTFRYRFAPRRRGACTTPISRKVRTALAAVTRPDGQAPSFMSWLFAQRQSLESVGHRVSGSPARRADVVDRTTRRRRTRTSPAGTGWLLLRRLGRHCGGVPRAVRRVRRRGIAPSSAGGDHRVRGCWCAGAHVVGRGSPVGPRRVTGAYFWACFRHASEARRRSRNSRDFRAGADGPVSRDDGAPRPSRDRATGPRRRTATSSSSFSKQVLPRASTSRAISSTSRTCAGCCDVRSLVLALH